MPSIALQFGPAANALCATTDDVNAIRICFNRRTDRPEWMNFWESFSEQQREAIRSYLNGVRSMFGGSADPVGHHLFDELKQIWERLQ